MRAAVAAAFFPFSSALEGHCSWPYLDIEGYVTTGIGNKIDPLDDALALPWTIDGNPGNPADVDTVVAAWHLVKADTALERAGGGAFKSLTRIRLTEDAIATLVRDTAAGMEAYLRKRFPYFDALCADAQLALLSMAWADGAEGIDDHFPHFAKLLDARVFATYTVDAAGTKLLTGGCAVECHLEDAHNPGLVPRNKLNAALFETAQRVADEGLDPDVLHYKDAPAASPVPFVDPGPPPTLPEA